MVGSFTIFVLVVSRIEHSNGTAVRTSGGGIALSGGVVGASGDEKPSFVTIVMPRSVVGRSSMWTSP